MNEHPLVTVNILSFNRNDELRNTLTKVFEQHYKNIEVIVVDNASTDGSAEMVKQEFPSVQLIQMEKNIGIAGWNEGFKAAKGEYVLVLDDDSYPDSNSIAEALKIFDGNDDLGILAYNIINRRINKSETELYKSKPRLFVGCGALIRSNVFRVVGLYNELYFIYLHELDFSARCYNAGFEILYFPNLIIFHNQSPLNRISNNQDPFYSEYRYKYYFISYSIFLIQNFDLNRILKYLTKWLINRLIVCVKYNYYKGFINSIIYLIKNFSYMFIQRKTLSESVQKFYDYGNIPLIDIDFIRNRR